MTEVKAPQPLTDAELVAHYTPKAIREHFDGTRHEAAVARLTDAQLREAGEIALENDITWMAFHTAVCEALDLDPEPEYDG